MIGDILIFLDTPNYLHPVVVVRLKAEGVPHIYSQVTNHLRCPVRTPLRPSRVLTGSLMIVEDLVVVRGAVDVDALIHVKCHQNLPIRDQKRIDKVTMASVQYLLALLPMRNHPGTQKCHPHLDLLRKETSKPNLSLLVVLSRK